MLATTLLLALAAPQEASPAKGAPAETRPESRPASSPASRPAPSNAEMIATGIERLVECQDNGAWPYEGVYREPPGLEIPKGYQVGGTAIVATALLYAAKPDDKRVEASIQKGIDFILKTLEDPRLEASTVDAYDVRVWGHACALELFSHLKAKKRLGPRAKEIEAWMPKLVKILVEEEIPGGGWNYATRQVSASFVTSVVAQSLLYARAVGIAVPTDVLDRAREILHLQHLASGAYLYDSRNNPNVGKKEANPSKAESAPRLPRTALLPGSVARNAACEATLLLLGSGNLKTLRESIEVFHEHWGELEKRRKKTGTHVGEYAIAPYYFYYGHRYAAQAIECLPQESRAKERARLLELLLRTRDEDGTWNDRHFPRSRAYGTAMVIFALLGDRQPMPPALAPMTKGK